MEVLKIAKQTSELSYMQITKNMIKEKGLAGVLDGYFPWGSIQCFAKGATLGFGQALGRKLLDGKVSDSVAETMSGGIGGGFQGLVMSPILLLKTRVITGTIASLISFGFELKTMDRSSLSRLWWNLGHDCCCYEIGC